MMNRQTSFVPLDANLESNLWRSLCSLIHKLLGRKKSITDWISNGLGDFMDENSDWLENKNYVFPKRLSLNLWGFLWKRLHWYHVIRLLSDLCNFFNGRLKAGGWLKVAATRSDYRAGFLRFQLLSLSGGLKLYNLRCSECNFVMPKTF